MVLARKQLNTTLETFLAEWNNASPLMLVHTSGSTGKPKPLMVEKCRMAASARVTCSFLGLKEGDSALLCMPFDYIAGKMVAVRAVVCGLRLIAVPPSGHPLCGLTEVPTFAAMVPMQVYNSLRVPAERTMLQQIQHLIIGGGAIDDDMAKELKTFPNAVWSTYGMTETLSHIALRRLSGSSADDWYTPFDSVNVSLNDSGCLVIDAPEVCASVLTTNDCAEIANDGRRFRIKGRKDNVIDSGGIKIHIEEVEHALRPHLHVPYMITKKADKKYGEIVVLLVQSSTIEDAKDVCTRVLPKYWQPRLYLSVSSIPMTETGKPARKQAEILAADR